MIDFQNKHNNTTTAPKSESISLGGQHRGFTQQGWQCPLCGRVYSPWTSMCYYCGNPTVTYTTTTATSERNK